jgi:hypothetical protein
LFVLFYILFVLFYVLFVLLYVYFVLLYAFFVLFYVFFCVVVCIFCVVLFTVCVYMCTEQLPPGGYPIAVKYMSYHIISYHIKRGSRTLFPQSDRLPRLVFTDIIIRVWGASFLHQN